jgi:hypothetical protein
MNASGLNSEDALSVLFSASGGHFEIWYASFLYAMTTGRELIIVIALMDYFPSECSVNPSGTSLNLVIVTTFWS